jgi:UDP-2,4-diacetamido-2,4,6-trideoxy-beta-L-altropyranose hydrolase
VSGTLGSARPSVVIRADGTAAIGGGHVMRCLSLANVLAARGADVTFVGATMTDNLAERVEREGHRLCRTEPVAELLSQGQNAVSAVLSSGAQRQDAERTRATAGAADWVVVDHYRLDESWIDAAAHDARCLVIDDLANRAQPCDILLDQTFGRVAADYAQWVPQECLMLLGARYALLRAEFSELRPQALSRRRHRRELGRLLISLGSTDIGGVTAGVLGSVLAAGLGCHIDVVLNSGAESLPAVRRICETAPHIHLHLDTTDMASLMLEADLAVGTAGTTSWERCCLGLPAVTLVVADNQRLVSQMLSQAEAAITVASVEEVGPAVLRLAEDASARARMSAAAAAITDGLGAARVADAMLGGTHDSANAPLVLRPVRVDDSEALWLWRNDPEMRRMAKTTAAIGWPDHVRWFTQFLQSGQGTLFIAEAQGQRAAMVRFDRNGDEALVSINVNPAFRGRGIGGMALAQACERYLADAPLARLVAEVRAENQASIKIFTAAGFTEQGRGGGDIHRFVRTSPARGGLE